MIIKLKYGEKIEYIAKISGMTVKEIGRLNGYIPISGQYFYINRSNRYVITAYDTIFSVSHKTHLTYDEILKRTIINQGKVFYY